jgi:DNA invertase Pin-like site-specific DNA recombinase
MAHGKFISYLRVSTQRQGQSGLGLEAQRKAVTDYLNGGNWELVAEFVEIESGKKTDRPQLAAALEACRKHKATLIIAKLDRLARSVSFIASMMDGNVEFTAVDFPQANRLTLHILAAVAEHEREAISARTKAALAAASARGKKLGWSNPSRAEEQRQATARANAAVSSQASRFAGNVLPIVAQVRAAGVTTLAGIADALNARGIHTARGGKWYATTVKNLLERAA